MDFIVSLITNPITIGLVSAVIGLVYIKYTTAFSFWSSRNVLGPIPSFPLGNYNETSKETHLNVYKKWIEKYGKVFGVYDILTPKLVVADADLVKQMFVKDFASLADRRTDYYDHPIEKKFSLFQEGKQWKRTRGVMTPAFSSAKFKNIFEQMDICSDKLVDYFDNLIAEKEANNIEASSLYKNYTSDSISRSIFNVSFIHSYKDPDKIIDSLMSYFDPSQVKMLISLFLPSWFKTAIRFSIFNVSSLNYAWSIFTKLIDSRRVENNNETQPVDMLKLMMEGANKVNWDDDDIKANLIIIYAAGSNTSSSLLAYISYIFAKYPQVQENVVKELNQLISEGKTITLDTVTNDFPYLNSVVCEVLRLYPPSTYNERKVSVKSYSFQYNGKTITIPRDTTIYFPTFRIQRDPDYFNDPDKFDDMRFMPENKDLINPYAYLPFGHGPRNCIGIRFAMTNIKLAVLKIAPKFKFKLVNESFDLSEDLSGTFDELLTTKPIHLIISKV